MSSMNYDQVAALYDLYVQVDFDVPFFLKEAKGCDEVLELTSGTGRVSIPLVRGGVNLTCVDSSPEMLALLENKLEAEGLSAKVHDMDMAQLELGRRFDLVFIPFNSFSELVRAEEQSSALVSVREHLTEGGRFIVTLHNPFVRLKAVDGRLRFMGQYPLPEDAGRLLLWIAENRAPGKNLVRGVQIYEEYDLSGVMHSRRTVDLAHYVHQKEGFEDLARTAGFEVTDLYGDYGRSPFDGEKSPFMIWILKRHAC